MLDVTPGTAEKSEIKDLTKLRQALISNCSPRLDALLS